MVSPLSTPLLKNEIWPGHPYSYVHSCTLKAQKSSAQIGRRWSRDGGFSEDREETVVPVSWPQMKICFPTNIHIFITLIHGTHQETISCSRHGRYPIVFETPVGRFKDLKSTRDICCHSDRTWVMHFHFLQALGQDFQHFIWVRFAIRITRGNRTEQNRTVIIFTGGKKKGFLRWPWSSSQKNRCKNAHITIGEISRCSPFRNMPLTLTMFYLVLLKRIYEA